MGILSDLFGAGRRRDEAQDRHIEELMSRVLTLEQSPGGGVGRPALSAGQVGDFSRGEQHHTNARSGSGIVTPTGRHRCRQYGCRFT